MAKPTVNCDLYMDVDMLVVGYCAIVQPHNHPNHIPGHQISNLNPVRTSRIVSVDINKKQFETLNTIYTWKNDHGNF